MEPTSLYIYLVGLLFAIRVQVLDRGDRAAKIRKARILRLEKNFMQICRYLLATTDAPSWWASEENAGEEGEIGDRRH